MGKISRALTASAGAQLTELMTALQQRREAVVADQQALSIALQLTLQRGAGAAQPPDGRYARGLVAPGQYSPIPSEDACWLTLYSSYTCLLNGSAQPCMPLQGSRAV